MRHGFPRACVRLVLACCFIVIAAAGAFAKGPDQAIVRGPGIEQPIYVREQGAPTIGPDMAALIESSGIMEQLWCQACDDLSKRQPPSELGPASFVRWRVPSLLGGPARWVEQSVYPFARPRPLTYVAPGQRFWRQRTVGGWYKSDPRLRRILLGLGVPRPAPIASPAVVQMAASPSMWIPVGAMVFGAIVGGMLVFAKGWTVHRRARRAYGPDFHRDHQESRRGESNP